LLSVYDITVKMFDKPPPPLPLSELKSYIIFKPPLSFHIITIHDMHVIALRLVRDAFLISHDDRGCRRNIVVIIIIVEYTQISDGRAKYLHTQ